MAKPKMRKGFKLLVASVGVASVNYLASCREPPISGNLPAPPPPPPSAEPIVGNLPAPPPPPADAGTLPVDAGVAPTAATSGPEVPPIAGNLPAPPPPPPPSAVPKTKPKGQP